MYDYGLSILGQYGVEAAVAARTRDALLCRTDRGLLLVRELRGSEKKLQKQQELHQTAESQGFLVDSYLTNLEGGLVTRDRDGIPYTVQRWYEGRECDTRSREDILESVSVLAGLHRVMKLPLVEYYREPDLADEYRRHSQEIRKIRKFIRQKGASNTFEKEYLSSVEWFLERASEAEKLLVESSYADLREKACAEGTVCHGEYNQHNVLILKRGTAVTGFSHWGFDVQMTDLYRFMRKILEKYGWDKALALEMLNAYDRVRPVSAAERELLHIRFSYPDKFWKIANYYYTHNKAWISEKNTQKLKNLLAQRDSWAEFSSLFRERGV